MSYFDRCSYSAILLGNKLFQVFDVLIKQIMVRFAQMNFNLHEHVVCDLKTYLLMR